MSNWQAVADRSATRETNIISRKFPEETPSSGKAEAAPAVHSKTNSSKISMSAASPFCAMLQDPGVSSDSLENEGRNFTLEEILVSAMKKKYFSALLISCILTNPINPCFICQKDTHDLK